MSRQWNPIQSYIRETLAKDIEEMQSVFPGQSAGNGACLTPLPADDDTKGGQSVLNGVEGLRGGNSQPRGEKAHLQHPCRGTAKGLEKGFRIFLLEL